jgi:predicted restriction endonuclease
VPENVLCLCANCHTLFDTGTLYVDSIGRKVRSLIETKLNTKLIEVDEHRVEDSYLDYHKEHIAGIRTPD